MIWRILVVLLWPALAVAQTGSQTDAQIGAQIGAQTVVQTVPPPVVAVTSGEHDGFTRLVLDFGSPVPWEMGRTEDGYALRLADGRRSYDLSAVFDIIGRSRLAAIWANPQSGALQIGIACPCYAMPFEFRPGIVVIDLRDGLPPDGSSFELALDGAQPEQLANRTPPRPRPRPRPPADASLPPIAGYDWIRLPPPVATASPLPATDPDLQPLRDALLVQLSRGAAQGVVELTVPPENPRQPAREPQSVRLGLGELPGLAVNAAGADLTAQGAACLADDQIDIAAWGTGDPVSEQMAGAMTGMVGEFDRPDPAALRRGVRFALYIGFGAEARQLLRSLPANLPEAAVLHSMARILDGDPDPQPAFAGMAACDSAAALWALLGQPTPGKGTVFARSAVLRTFSALPIHLRRHLGPVLSDRLLALGDAAAAQSVQDAVLRAPGDAGPGADLTDARLKIAAGDAQSAAAILQPIIDTPGPTTSEALITLVELQLSQRQPVTPADVTALAAGLQERLGSPEAARYRRALVLARAAAGDYATAFADLADAPEAEAELWALLAETGPDSALLEHAVRNVVPDMAAPVAGLMAQRLWALGFGDAAAMWQARTAAPDARLAARIDLQRGDARAALRQLAGAEDAEAMSMKSEALQQLGDDDAMAGTLTLAGETEAAWRAVARAGDWPRLAADGPAPWQMLAASLGATGADQGVADARPLAAARSLLDTSTATRAAVDALLLAVSGPPIFSP